MPRTEPGQDQESVWDYPRPPRLEPAGDHLRVDFAGEIIATTEHGFRLLETSHPPVYYIPASDVRREFLERAPGQSFCEFKGVAIYWSLEVNGKTSEAAAWSYPVPTESFAAVADHLAFYASRVDACWVGQERVAPQDGDFYGGWITPQVVGPFKGGAGTRGW
ncbi:MAG: hypothetical protein CL566_08190 [Alphaproteobacteria bacterium]|nr:hypothetical protein [Alphaproteobacteria bacterium]